MSAGHAKTPPVDSAASGLGTFERWLSVWVAAAIGAGILAGRLAPELFESLAALEVAGINLLIGVLIWAMVYPMMLGVDLAALGRVREQPRGIAITLAVNWLVKPFTMALVGAFFLKVLFAPLIPASDADSYLAGLILLGAAPCTAMVFVWSNLVRGDAGYTLVQVGVNDVIMIFAYAPIVALLLGISDIPIPWDTLLLSVLLYVVVPLAAGALTRRVILSRGGPAALERFRERAKPVSVIALLATVMLLFGFQGDVLLSRPLVIALIAVPLLVQSYGVFFLAWALARRANVPFEIAAPCALIGTSNFFELAVAVAIGLYGLDSGAALATVVGVLVEVPVMLSLVAWSNARRPTVQGRHP